MICAILFKILIGYGKLILVSKRRALRIIFTVKNYYVM